MRVCIYVITPEQHTIVELKIRLDARVVSLFVRVSDSHLVHLGASKVVKVVMMGQRDNSNMDRSGSLDTSAGDLPFPELSALVAQLDVFITPMCVCCTYAKTCSCGVSPNKVLPMPHTLNTLPAIHPYHTTFPVVCLVYALSCRSYGQGPFSD